MDCEQMYACFLLAFFALVVLSFFLQRLRCRIRKLLGKAHLGFYPNAASLGNALQALQIFVEPNVQQILEEKLDEATDEDDEGGPDDPTTHLNCQLRKIRRGEPVDDLRIPLVLRK
jgi:hypothetical protein